MLNFYFLENGLGIASPSHFVYDFSRKMFLMLCSVNWPNCLIAFASWDIGQYLYCNCLLSRLRRHKFEMNLIFPIKPFFFVSKKFKYLGNKKDFKVKYKAFFIILKDFKSPQIVSGLRVRVVKLFYE